MTRRKLRNHLITIGTLVLAIACYARGLFAPGAFFLAIGAVAELIFWYRLWRARRQARK